MAAEKVAKDLVVTLQYKLMWEDGELVEESEQDDPLMYLHGHENIIPGLEEALEGMSVGEKKTVMVEPENGYGEYDPEDMGRIERSELPPEFEPEPGMIIEVTDDEGDEAEAVILEVDDEGILLDFNDPMAGERLHFEVEIIGIRAPTSEELDHGHVHDEEHHH
jgi:FKBP-type peptidyl-prolyl cis-trans isomerase SlyD